MSRRESGDAKPVWTLRSEGSAGFERDRSGRGLPGVELDDEEGLQLLLQGLQLRVGDDRVGDLGGLTVPGLLDAELAVLGSRQADAALAREQEGRQVGDLLAVGVLRGLLQELLEELLHGVDVLEALHFAAGHPGLPEG